MTYRPALLLAGIGCLLLAAGEIIRLADRDACTFANLTDDHPARSTR